MRKSGAKHSCLAIVPLNAKSTRQEFKVRAALTAINADCADQDNLVELYVLAALCDGINDSREPHVTTHCDAIRRLCNEIHEREYHCSTNLAQAMQASVDVLIKWLAKQSNKRVHDAALSKMREILAR